MSDQDLNRIVIPAPILRRIGSAQGSALKAPRPKFSKDVKRGTPEWVDAMARHLILSGPWVKVRSDVNVVDTSLYINALFAQSCREIIIAAKDETQFNYVTGALPVLARRHLSFAAHRDISYSVRAYLTPIAKDLARLGVYDPQKQNSPDTRRRSLRDSAHPLVVLAGEIYLLAVAAAEKAQLDGSSARFLGAIRQLQQNELSSESHTRLSLVEGLLKRYTSQDVAQLTVLADTNTQGVSDTLFRLLDESLFLDLSAEWHRLGLVRARQATLRRIRILCRDLVRRRNWKSVVELTTQAIMMLTPFTAPGSKLVDLLAVQAYSPLLATLDHLKIGPIAVDIPDREHILDSLSECTFADEAFVDKKIAAGALTMHWDLFTDELLPDFSFSDELA